MKKTGVGKLVCAKKGCRKNVMNTKYHREKAISSGWYSSPIGLLWCPDHADEPEA